MNNGYPPPPQGQGHTGQILGLSESGIIWLCYILYACAIFCGGVTAIPAIIINYIKRSDAAQGRSSALMYSHMDWQINTFWRTFLFTIICAILTFILTITFFGAILIWPLWLGLMVWYAYRLLKGMLAINGGYAVH